MGGLGGDLVTVVVVWVFNTVCVVLGNLGGTWAVRIWLLGLCVASDLVSSRGHGFGSQTSPYTGKPLS